LSREPLFSSAFFSFLEQAPDAREFLQRLGLELEQARRLRRRSPPLRTPLVLLDLLPLPLLGRAAPAFFAVEVSFAFGSMRPSTTSSMRDSSFSTLVGEVEDVLHRGRAGADRLDHVAQARPRCAWRSRSRLRA
jgi:hypothetical protein